MTIFDGEREQAQDRKQVEKGSNGGGESSSSGSFATLRMTAKTCNATKKLFGILPLRQAQGQDDSKDLQRNGRSCSMQGDVTI
jgi:hypothetical protein